MKTSRILGMAIAAAAMLFAGCVSQRRATTPRPRAYALAVTVQGGLQPTPAQWAAIQAAAVKELAAVDCFLVTDLALADMILRIEFIPNPLDPDNSGRAVVLGVRPNPRATLASLTTLSSASPYRSSWTTSPFAYSSYYGYPSYHSYSPFGWSDGYVYDPPSGSFRTPPPPATVTPPHRGHPENHGNCPPGYSPPTFAGNRDHDRDGGRGHHRGGSPGSSHPDPGYSNRSSGSDYSSSSSSSSGSYSSGSYSSGSSSSGSSYASSSSSSYSSSSYSGSSGSSNAVSESAAPSREVQR